MTNPRDCDPKTCNHSFINNHTKDSDILGRLHNCYLEKKPTWKYNIFDDTKLTREEESKNKILFLHILLNKTNTGTLEAQVYKNQIHIY